MNLTRHELAQILETFPRIKLSYEKTIHKKVSSSNIYLSIPRGNKHFAWFRNYRRHSVCFILELDRQRRGIKGIKIKRCCFDRQLCAGKGTVLYGTIFFHKTNFFNIEDIFYLKDANLTRCNQFTKLKAITSLFDHYIRQTGVTTDDLIFGMPVLSKSREQLLKAVASLPYPIYCIQHRLLYKSSTFLNERLQIETNYEENFAVQAEISPDIYILSYRENDKEVLYKYACIPDYKTSVMMNSLFRDIKENADLDKLEESDDEEEFENISADKFVNLERKILMRCVYMHKFKSWKPIAPLEKGKSCERSAVMRVEKNNT